jgi:SAM-dependent methyltransferase
VEASRLDPDEFRARQRRDWGRSSKGWHEWEERILSAGEPMSRRLIELAGIKEGDRVLDVATGSGEPSLTVAQLVGSEGRVVASDLSPDMLALARNRAAGAQIGNVEFVEAAASSLEFPPESFDAALSRWGIIFEPEAEAAAARIRSFLKPGARMAISSWGPPERVPMIALSMRVVAAELDLSPPPPGTPGPLSRATPDAIGGLLSGGGFADVHVDELELDFEWESVDEFVAFTQAVSAALITALEQHPDEVREHVLAALADAARPYAGADGRVRMKSLALVAAGSA